MRNISYIFALFAVLFLAMSGVAWWKIVRVPDEIPPSPGNIRRSSSASMIILIAFGLSAAAALIAVIGWIQT